MTASYNATDLVQAGTLDKMLRRFAALMSNPTAIAPHYDSSLGEYDNIGDWLALSADGLVYGVKKPLYAYSPVTTAIKTGANAGLVLEASTEAYAGRNDYEGRLLFKCPRCNATVDVDGNYHVTAIEGYDDRFDAKLYNTYTIRPVYYKKVTRDASYETKEFTDTPRTGFKAVRGAYTTGGTKRDFILRACYMDSDGTMDSKSGTVPAANYSAATDNCVAHCANNDFTWSKDNTSNGLTFLDYGDVQEQMDFMELMCGVKAPRDAAAGCVSYDFQYTVASAENGVKRVLLTDAQAANVLVGSSLSIGDGSTATTDRYQQVVHNLAKSAKVLSKVSQGGGITAVNLDLNSAIDVPATATVKSMPWRNGSCDGVLGTFGSPTSAGLTNGKEPFKFLNVEWQLGLYETVHNMYSSCQLVNGVNTHTWYIANDVKNCSGINTGSGWTALSTQTLAATNNAWNSIKDYKEEKGAPVPESVGGTSSTGYRTSWHPGSATEAAALREVLVGGNLSNGAHAGVGCRASGNALSAAAWDIGGRSSAIGRSAHAE